mmetsp:Transcript_36423/g.71663  ORF Transcript_36423/g.71663 Transcript_36423/m.71663 type:complete len:229 (+) Transcript_36423:4047-4733(+)
MSKRPPSPPYRYTFSTPVACQRTRRPSVGTPSHGSTDNTVPYDSFGFCCFFFFLLELFNPVGVSSTGFSFAGVTSTGSSTGLSPDDSSVSGDAGISSASLSAPTVLFGSDVLEGGSTLSVVLATIFSGSGAFFGGNSFPSSSPYFQSIPRSTRHPFLKSGGPSPLSTKDLTLLGGGFFHSIPWYSTTPVQISQFSSHEIKEVSRSTVSVVSRRGSGVAESYKIVFFNG